MTKTKKKPNVFKRASYRLGLFTRGDLAKALQYLREDDARRSPVMEYQTDALNKIVEIPYNYASLIKISLCNEVVRINHEAVIREALRNGAQVVAKYACKCKRCGMEYQTEKTSCEARDCDSTEFTYPDYSSKQMVQALIESPNRDDSEDAVNESLIRFMLSTDDYWLSYQPADEKTLRPAAVYVEDAAFMHVCWDENRGVVGNGEYFCPVCTKKFPTEKYQKGERCKRHSDVELKETAYVYAEGSEVKARFARDECFHGVAHPWRPSFYGNSLLISALRIVMSITAMDTFNYDNYSTGKLAQILVFVGLSPEEATELALQVQRQTQAEDVNQTLIQQLQGQSSRLQPVVNKLRTLFLGGKGDVKAVNATPESEKMQSLDWWKLWREVIGSLYGVTPIFSGVVESGKTGNNPRMQIDVQNNTTEYYQHKLEDAWNWVFERLGVTDWLYRCNAVEEKDEMQDTAVLAAKLDVVDKAISLGFTAELTDEGEVKISGSPLSKDERYRRSQEKFEQQQVLQQNQNQQNVQPSEGGGDGGKPFGKESLFSQEKGKRWIVAEIPNHGHGDKHE